MSSSGTITTTLQKMANERHYQKSNKTIENKENALTLYKIMKDADALDRVRFGLMDLDERYLRFNASKQLVLTAKVCLESITDGK